MIDPHHITATVTLFLGIWAARGYIPNLRSQMTPPASSLAWGFFFFAIGSIGRTIYWSFARVVLGEHWAFIRDELGGLNINIGFDCFLIGGLLMILRARLLAIPKEERDDYNILTCVTYPEPFRLSSILRRNTGNEKRIKKD